MMTQDDMKALLSSLFPGVTFEEGTEWLTMSVEPGSWSVITQQLRHHEDLLLDYMFCLTCIDWKVHLQMVYHLTSTRFRHNLVIKSKLDANNPAIGTCSHIWKTALFHEREVYEMFGVRFEGHPDLRLLILPDGWEGRNPMRKDYDDPVNMIRL
jgi:NADH:ubiquinone oxidoreductase subunit C